LTISFGIYSSIVAALSHHLLKLKASPYDEAATDQVTTHEKQTMHKVQHFHDQHGPD